MKPRLKREFVMTVDLTEMWCGGGMDEGMVLCTVMHHNIHEVTTFLDVCASLKFLVNYRNFDILMTVHLSIIYVFLFPTWKHCLSVCVQYLLSSFLYMFQASQAHHQEAFFNGRTTKTSAEGENTIGCMYNLDLLMMGLW